MTHYVIIGGSAAGIQAAEEIRRFDAQGEITVISSEKHYPYSRCLISRYVEGKLTLEGLRFRTGHFFDDLGVRGLLNVRVERIDPPTRQVFCADGSVFGYDKLLLATGARPATPRIPGTQLSKVFNFHTMEDAEHITEAARNCEHAVVLGGGFAGLEAAYALVRTGKKVTVVERAGQILPNQLDTAGSRIIHEDLAHAGVHIILNSSVSEIRGEGSVSDVVLSDHSAIPADLVVLATGIRPNKELAEEAGLVVNRGIIVNEYMQTSNADIYAAGDVIEIEDVATGRRVLSATWFNAVMQGRFAGSNMAGRHRTYTDAVGIQNAVQFHHVPAISFGQTLVGVEDTDEFEVIAQEKAGVYKKLVLLGNKLVGMIFVGDIAKAGLYAAIIRHRLDITRVKDRLLDNDFSYAYLLKEHQFGQRTPYGTTSPEWDNAAFWTQRAQSVGIVR
ncbi:MAG: NAD(P)/FAD-dependent oxidoreductase [Anaerolineae bacterium]